MYHILEALHPVIHRTFVLVFPDNSLSISTCFEWQDIYDKKLTKMPTRRPSGKFYLYCLSIGSYVTILPAK